MTRALTGHKGRLHPAGPSHLQLILSRPPPVTTHDRHHSHRLADPIHTPHPASQPPARPPARLHTTTRYSACVDPHRPPSQPSPNPSHSISSHQDPTITQRRSSKTRVSASESPVIIPPKSRKRKAAEAKLSSTNKDLHPNKRTSAAAAHPTQGSPPTPVTTASTNMDSDDDMISNLSSDDDVLQDESDNSADDGALRSAPFPAPFPRLTSPPGPSAS